MTTLARIPDADEALTACLARVLAALLGPGDSVLLDGPVGAGKTHFARALIRARQGDAAEDVPSPTFTIVQTYEDAAGTEIWHADLYRLIDPAELFELGLEDAMPEAITQWVSPRSRSTVQVPIRSEPHSCVPSARRATRSSSNSDFSAVLTIGGTAV